MTTVLQKETITSDFGLKVTSKSRNERKILGVDCTRHQTKISNEVSGGYVKSLVTVSYKTLVSTQTNQIVGVLLGQNTNVLERMCHLYT